jgi:hypothetical protein
MMEGVVVGVDHYQHHHIITIIMMMMERSLGLCHRSFSRMTYSNNVIY